MKIPCTSVFGNTVFIEQEKISIRVSAYGIITHNKRILLLRMKDTGKYCLPGGGIDAHEKMIVGLSREIKEEVGLEFISAEMLGSRETFFYYDPWDTAWHNFSFFYSITPLNTTIPNDHIVEDEGAELPKWIPIDTLQETDFQVFGEEIIYFLQYQKFPFEQYAKYETLLTKYRKMS